MVKIYIVRHCEAAGNLKKTLQGRTDCDISEDGAKQLLYLKERFSEIAIDKAYSSPLIRALKTAKAAVDGKGIEVVTDIRFAELNCGVLDGKPFEEIFRDFPWFLDVWDNRLWEFSPEGGEAMSEVYERMWDGLCDIAKDPDNEGKTVLIASHGAAIRSLCCRLIFNDIKKLCYTDWACNTAVTLITYDNGEFKLELLNDATHLPENLIKTSRLLSKKDL